MRGRWLPDLLAIALIGLLGVGLLWPIAAVVQGAFVEGERWTLVWFQDLLDQPLLSTNLTNSLLLAVYSTLACLLISVPLALLADRFSFAGKGLLTALILVPMILPPFVGALGLKAMLSRNGGLNELLIWLGLIDAQNPIDFLASPFWACVILEALGLYPIAFLNIQAALANINPALDEAARNLGAGAWKRFWRITLPMMRPGLFAGGTLVFIWTFTEIGTPLIVGFKELAAVQVFDELTTQAPAGDTYALVILLLAASVAFYFVGKLLLGRSTASGAPKATVSTRAAHLRGVRGMLAAAPFVMVFSLAVLPHVGVLLLSVSSTGMLEWSPQRMTWQHHQALLFDSQGLATPGGLARASIVNSLHYSALATGATVVLGFAIAYLAVRRRSVLTSVLDSLSMLPLAVPGLVLAFGYFAMTQGESSWFKALDPLRNSPLPLLVIAYTVRRLPFMVRSCSAGLEQTSIALEEAAINLGASRWWTLWRIVAPLLAANFIAGSLLVFSRSMLEVSDSLLLAFDRDTYPLTKAIWSLAAIPANGVETAAALGVWGMGILVCTLLGSSLLLGRKLGALFRV